MRIHLEIDKENDQIYLSLAPLTAGDKGVVARTVEVAPDIYADFDTEGRLIGLDINNASQVLQDGNLDYLVIDELIGVKEAASLVGVKKPNFVRDYANKPDFPQPVVELASGRIWLRSQVEKYNARRGSTDSTPLVAVLAAMQRADHIAFRHVALTHFGGHFLDTRPEPPTLEEVALVSVLQDQQLLEGIQSGSEDEYISSAETLFRKYSPASKSIVRSLLAGRNEDKTDALFKEIWAEAFREAQLTEAPLEKAGTFTRWILMLSCQILARYQFPADPRVRGQLEQDFDPIEGTVVLERLRTAKNDYERRIREYDAERFMLEYLDSLSSDEMSEFFGDRYRAKELDLARRRMKAQLRRTRPPQTLRSDWRPGD